jgi:hypothetical protein
LNSIPQLFQMKIYSIDLNDADTLFHILNGAALTIQSCWRNYAKTLNNYNTTTNKKKHHHHLLTSPFSNPHVQQACIETGSSCDVIIYVHGKAFYCHSHILSATSAYFRKTLPNNNTNTQHQITYMKFELLVSEKCWRVVQKFMYGYDVEIDDSDELLLAQLVRIARELEMTELLRELSKLSRFDQQYSSSSSSSSASSSTSLTPSTPFSLTKSAKYDIYYLSSSSSASCNETTTTTIYSVHEKPIQLVISNFYEFFKCVVYFYCRKKLDLNTAYAYLAPDFIDYSQMSDCQLRKCLYLLKTKLKLKNSRLLLKVIEIYMGKKGENEQEK